MADNDYTQPLSDRTHCAIHEAGHVVAHHRQGRMTAQVTIIPDHETGQSGSTVGENADFSVAGAKEEVLALCAGYAALKAIGCDEDHAQKGAWDDFDKATEIIDTYRLGDLAGWRTRAVELMSDEENIKAVRRVADELLADETISGEVAEYCCDIADGTETETDLAEFKQFRDSCSRPGGSV